MPSTAYACPAPATFAFAQHINRARYNAMYKQSLEQPDVFWAERSREFLDFQRLWDRVSDCDMTKGQARWFEGAQLNVSVNCIDRHLATRGDQVAINQRPFAPIEETAPAFYEESWFMPLIKQGGAILAALLAFLFIGRPLIKSAKARASARAERDAGLEQSLLAVAEKQALTAPNPGATREITLEMIEAAPSYEARANLVRAFVRQDSARAALVVRQLMQEGARG